jgi:hypothetical protein
VLHVGTGDVNFMVLAVDTCNGPTAYAGPVFSYYERVESGLNRLLDEEWKDPLRRQTARRSCLDIELHKPTSGTDDVYVI